MKRKRTIRNKKKRNGLKMFEKRSEPKFTNRSPYCRFCDRKNGQYRCRWRQVLFIVSTPIFQAVQRRTEVSGSDWNTKNYATRQTATKFGYVLILLLAFLFKRSVPLNSSHFTTNPLNPQPVTSMQNPEILSRYLSCYSVKPQRPSTSTTVLPQYHNSPFPISSNASLLPGDKGVVTSLLSYLLVQQRNCKLNFFFFSFFYTNSVTSVLLVYRTDSDICNTVICENKYLLTLVLLPISFVVAQTGVVEYFLK